MENDTPDNDNEPESFTHIAMAVANVLAFLTPHLNNGETDHRRKTDDQNESENQRSETARQEIQKRLAASPGL